MRKKIFQVALYVPDPLFNKKLSKGTLSCLIDILSNDIIYEVNIYYVKSNVIIVFLVCKDHPTPQLLNIHLLNLTHSFPLYLVCVCVSANQNRKMIAAFSAYSSTILHATFLLRNDSSSFHCFFSSICLLYNIEIIQLQNFLAFYLLGKEWTMGCLLHQSSKFYSKVSYLSP